MGISSGVVLESKFSIRAKGCWHPLYIAKVSTRINNVVCLPTAGVPVDYQSTSAENASFDAKNLPLAGT